MVWAGGSASRTIEDQSSTDPGGGFRQTKQHNCQWQMPAGRNKGRHWAADSQEFPVLGRPPVTVGNTKELNGLTSPSTAYMDRLPEGSPTPVFRKSDRGMRPAHEMWPTPHKDIIKRIRGVTKTIATPLSALAENFTPRKTSRIKPSTSRMPMDSELDRSLSGTGPGKIENPQDIIEIDIARIGVAYPTEINKPMTMADVTGAGGLVISEDGGPALVGTRFLAVAEVYSRTGKWRVTLKLMIEKWNRILVPRKRKLVSTC